MEEPLLSGKKNSRAGKDEGGKEISHDSSLYLRNSLEGNILLRMVQPPLNDTGCKIL